MRICDRCGDEAPEQIKFSSTETFDVCPKCSQEFREFIVRKDVIPLTLNTDKPKKKIPKPKYLPRKKEKKTKADRDTK